MLIQKPEICSIVAVGPNDVIGLGDSMPWRSSQDFWHFRKQTIPNPCIFGRNTYNGLPVKPLKDRFNLVVSSSNKNELIDGVFYANTLESALKQCKDYERVFICGGAQLYKYALERDLIDVMYLSRINSPELSNAIMSNVSQYKYFPFNTEVFFGGKNWQEGKIVYPEIPAEKFDVRAEFFKYVRVR